MNKAVYFLLVFSFLIMPSFVYADSLGPAKKAYLRGDYSETIRICLEKINNNVSDEALYFAGLSFSKLGDYPRARGYFRRLLKEFKGSSLYSKALIKLTDTYFLEGDLGRSKTLYRSILKEYPDLSYKPLVYLRLAQVSAKQGNWQDMHHYINIIKHNYAYSVEDRLAKRLERRGDFFTVQIGAFSSKANAVRFSKRFRSICPAYIVAEREEDFTLYKVRVGKYRTKAEAEHIFNKLSNEGYPARIYP